MARHGKPLPVVLDNASRESFTNQLVSGIRLAIQRGYYREGDVLPTWRAMSENLGVSVRVPRDAMKRLSLEGYVVSRRRIGCIVAHPDGKRQWKGTVLCVWHDADQQSFFFAAITKGLRAVFLRAGYQAISIGVPRSKSGKLDFAPLSIAKEMNAGFCVQFCHNASVTKWISGLGVPFLSYSGYESVPNCVGRRPSCTGRRAVAAFAQHCVRAGVRRVLQVGFCAASTISIARPLCEVGISVDRWIVPPLAGSSWQEGLREAARRAVVRRFGRIDRQLPDLIFFDDDYLAAGGLFALAQIGVSVPRDVKVAIFANEGDLPVSQVSLTCIMYRPEAVGRLIGRRVVKHLRGEVKGDEGIVDIDMEYRVGESFPDA